MVQPTKCKFRLLGLLIALWTLSAQATTVTGTVTDSISGETLIGVSVLTGDRATVTDIDGRFTLTLPAGKHQITYKYIGYSDLTATVDVGSSALELTATLQPADEELGEVTVVGRARNDTEVAVLHRQKVSLTVQTGIGAAQIAKTQDRDASEVIRRIPGISIIDDKFVMVRGLSQRYNNVWVDGGAAPSSEADSRAFSFDIIPSSQLDNITIVKSPAPEYPADYTGGFIMVNTRREPTDGGLNLSLGVGVNDRTHFRSYYQAKGSTTDFLGFDNGLRRLDAGMDGTLNYYDGYDTRIDVLNNGFNNNWLLKERHPWGDLKAAADYSKVWRTDGGARWSLLAAANYSNSYKTMTDMENSLYGPYDTGNDKAVFLRKAVDNQWSNDVRLGAMLNISFRPAGGAHLYEWNNIFNQLARDRYSDRSGYNAQPDNIHNQEYYYCSRTTYNTRFSGRHTFEHDDIDWCAGYAYANRDMPDRRLIEQTDRTDNRMGIYRISREFTHLDEHILSIGANWRHHLEWSWSSPELKAGVYGEYCTRKYRAREFQYGWQPDNTLPTDFMFDDDVATNVLVNDNYGADKLYLYEEVNMLNNYAGRRSMLAGYVGFNMPVGKFNIYAGCRYEYMRQVLTMNTLRYEESAQDTPYDYSDFFPSVNMTYKIDSSNQLRIAYGRSVNRPEFRELSTSVYYDFDLGSSVMGNYDLKAAYIQNIDLRYEWYPTAGEQVSLAVFYKHFDDPIEWTYTVSGGTDLVYSFVNAKGADNYGVELDVRKSLDFIGMKDFSLSFNGALIKSKVQFEEGSNNIDRPMQGQSPYLVNVGLFYNNGDSGWNAALLYNRIGKRITGVGNHYGTDAAGISRNIPNSYELPRNSIDLSVSKRLGRWDVKVGIRDLLAEKYRYSQYEQVTMSDGTTREIEEINRSYRPGRTFNITVNYKF